MPIKKPTGARSGSRKTTTAKRPPSTQAAAQRALKAAKAVAKQARAATENVRSQTRSAAKMAKAAFGGIFRRRPSKHIHELKGNDYRQTPYFKTPRVVSKPKLTLRWLYDNAYQPDVLNARFVRLRTLKAIPMPKPLAKYYAGMTAMRATTHTDTNGHSHEIFMAFEPNEDGELTPKSKVVISCTCARFCFAQEFKLAAKGGSFHYFSNGMPPTQLFVPSSVCKHSFRLIGWVLKHRSHLQPDAKELAKAKAKADKKGSRK